MACRVLIADDCALIRRSVRQILEREGFAIVGEASNGREVVELARELSPDVVILDLAMPGMSGIEAAREIHRGQPLTGLILLTGHTTEDHIIAAMRSGMLAFVAKTDVVEDLARAVREAALGATYLSLKPARIVLDALLQASDR
jgi:DNA-binding NarL/FixJ family response regulator